MSFVRRPFICELSKLTGGECELISAERLCLAESITMWTGLTSETARGKKAFKLCVGDNSPRLRESCHRELEARFQVRLIETRKRGARVRRHEQSVNVFAVVRVVYVARNGAARCADGRLEGELDDVLARDKMRFR